MSQTLVSKEPILLGKIKNIVLKDPSILYSFEEPISIYYCFSDDEYCTSEYYTAICEKYCIDVWEYTLDNVLQEVVDEVYVLMEEYSDVSKKTCSLVKNVTEDLLKEITMKTL